MQALERSSSGMSNIRAGTSYRRILLLLATDFFIVFFTLGFSLWLRFLSDRSLPWHIYFDLWPMLVLFLLAYALAGLYAVGIAPPDELRRISYTTSLVFVILGATTFIYKAGPDYSRGAFVFAWILALVLVPLGRVLIKQLFSRRDWWGVPVVVLGAGRTGEVLVQALVRQPGMGLRPVALLDDNPYKHGHVCGGVLVEGHLTLAANYARIGVQHVILAMPGVPRSRLLELLETYGNLFPHIIVIPDLLGFSSLWVTPKDMGGLLGLEVRQNLLLKGSRLAKRILDLGLIVLFSPLIVLLCAIFAILIRFDSKGPVFYSHTRIGQGRRPIRAWKFRTMVQDADKVLKDYLDQHTELRDEWLRDHKLREDPRVTRVGRFLRKTSLDELPQLWNVIRGEMSIVGPRPIVEAEVERYGDRFSLYTRVLPGLTGIWQVSGRNDTSYAERVALDSYYVRNWSVWLDFYILARTVSVVLAGKGAY